MRVESRAFHELGNRLHPIRQRAVPLTERQLVSFIQVDDLTVFDCNRNEALSAEHAVATEALVQDFQVTHAVQERQDDGVWPNGRRERSNRVFEIVGFATEQHEIEGLAEILGQHGGRFGKTHVAARDCEF